MTQFRVQCVSVGCGMAQLKGAASPSGGCGVA